MSKISLKQSTRFPSPKLSRVITSSHRSNTHIIHTVRNQIPITTSRLRISSLQKQKRISPNRVRMSRNLREFQSQIKSHSFQFKDKSLNGYGIASYAGVNQSSNSHHLSLHTGTMTNLSLFQSIDGTTASVFLRKKVSNLLSENQKTEFKEDSGQYLQHCFRKTYRQLHKQLYSYQKKQNDNSGSTLISLILYQNSLICGNIGPSSAMCLTKHGKIIPLANSHNTNNVNELKRIDKQGGRFYKTIITIPNSKGEVMQGPIRVYPHGMTITRFLGKPSLNLQLGDYSKPEIIRIQTKDIRWIIMLSSSLTQLVKQARLIDIIEQQISKVTQNYTFISASEHACKRVILQGVECGAKGSLTCLILIGDLKIQNISTNNEILESKYTIQSQVNPENIQKKRAVSPLRYIGSRNNFVQFG